MINYGFDFETLYHLDLNTLYDVVRIIRGEDTYIAPDHEVIIRGCILPFLRQADRAARDADKNTVMRLALIVVAKQLQVTDQDWNDADTQEIAAAVRLKVQSLVADQLEKLDPEERAKLLGVAQSNLAQSAKTMGVPLAGAGAVIAGELSGFGIYMATTTGLHALSLALGTTFSWGVYQGATTLLGIILGPVGWAIAGVGVVGSLTVSILNWAKARRGRTQILAVIALLFAIGENPFVFFGLSNEATLDDIQSAYRAMMKTLHPDRREKNLPQWIHDDFDQKLLRCREAYDKLQRILGEYVQNV